MKTDVIIPVRNETLDTLLPVINAFVGYHKVGYIWLVDNGNSDETTDGIWTMLGTYDQLMDLVCKTPGKGQAVSVGLRNVQSSRVMFCDADLTGFKRRHVSLMLAETRGMVLGVTDAVPGHPPWPVDAETRALCTGVRVMPTWLPRQCELHGYAMEAVINRKAAATGVPVSTVPLIGVRGKSRWTQARHDSMYEDGRWLTSYMERDDDGTVQK